MRNSSYTVKNKTTSSYTTNNEAGNKSTNINILLNRVRLDKRRTLKKRIILSITLISLVSSIAVYFNI